MTQTEKLISLTPSAFSHIQKLLAQQSAEGLRLSIKKTGCSGYAYITECVNEKKPNDIVVKQENLMIFVDPNAAPLLNGTILDFVDQGLGQTKLLFHNPNAANLCGCGESFNLADDASKA